MSETLEFAKQNVPTGDPSCLHCAIRFMIAAWIQQHCERADDGTPKIAIEKIAVNMAMALANFVEAVPEGPTRDAIKIFSLVALDKCLNDPTSANVGTRH